AIKCRWRYPEKLRRLPAVPARFLECIKDLLSFDVPEVRRRDVLKRSNAAVARRVIADRNIRLLRPIDDLGRKLFDGHSPVVGKQSGTLEAVAKLSYISAPRISAERL